MIHPKVVVLPLLAAALAALAVTVRAPTLDGSLRCRMDPGNALALVRVVRDTTMLVPAGSPWRSTPPATSDSTAGPAKIPLPGGRVRLLRMDVETREILGANGIGDAEPTAYLQALTYGADCGALPWRDPHPFLKVGEEGFVRGHLAARERWIDGVPLIVVPYTGDFPYPRRRGLLERESSAGPLAPAEAVFELASALRRPSRGARDELDFGAIRDAAVEWARVNAAAAELEPARTLVRRSVLDADMWEVDRTPSRLRGSYRVEFEVAGDRISWFFRTADRSPYSWRPPGPLPSTAELLRAPRAEGYRLVGFASPERSALPDSTPRLGDRLPLVWLATSDRPTEPGNDSRRVLDGELQLQLGAVPERLWSVLAPLRTAPAPLDSAMSEWLERRIPPEQRTVTIPITVRLHGEIGVRADTMLVVQGREVRLRLERIDTLSLPRPYAPPH